MFLDLARIERIAEMPHLMGLLASRVGHFLNVEELARTTRLNSMTLHRYMTLLEALFMIYLLPAWHSHLGKRLVKSPKLYLNDTALQLFNLHVDTEKLLADPYLMENVMENFVVMELLKQCTWSGQNIRMYHYRDYRQSEVDIILEGPNGKLVAIEFKSSETISAQDFKSLRLFLEENELNAFQGILLYAGSQTLAFGDKLTAVPLSALWEGF